MTAIDVINQQVLDANPNATQQNNFTGNSGRAGNTATLFIYEEAKETK